MVQTLREPTSNSHRHWRLRDVLRSLGGGPGYHGPQSDHFDGQFFFNPDNRAGRSVGEFFRWQWTRQRTPWPRWIENRSTPHLPAALQSGQAALTFINHITFLLQLQGLNILLDPVYSQRVSPFRRVGPARVRDPGLPFEALPPIQLVLVTHNHYDHLDIETLLRLDAAHSPQFITTLGNRAFLEQFSLSRVIELDWWQSVDLPGARLTLTPAQHWSSRGPRNRNRTLGVDSCCSRTLCRSTSPAIRAMESTFARFAIAWGASTSHFYPLAPMSRAGSCATST